MRAGRSLIVLAILLKSGDLAAKWHRGWFAYQRVYAARVERYERLAARERGGVVMYEPHAAPTHSCSICRQWPQPVSALLKRDLGRWLDNERNAESCRRMAEPPFRFTYQHTAAEF